MRRMNVFGQLMLLVMGVKLGEMMNKKENVFGNFSTIIDANTG